MRVKLHEHYSEYVLRNRINAKKKYEFEIEKKISSAKKDSAEIMVLRTVKFYTIAFSNGNLPMRKRNKQKPFSWNNDSELDKIIELNNRINSGATLETLRKDFENAENSVAEKEKLKESAKIFSMAKKVFGGTYVQSLVGEKRERRESGFVPNGLEKYDKKCHI